MISYRIALHCIVFYYIYCIFILGLYIFRLHHSVVMGADGPFTVIQSHGANEYVLNTDDLFWSRAGKSSTSTIVLLLIGRYFHWAEVEAFFFQPDLSLYSGHVQVKSSTSATVLFLIGRSFYWAEAEGFFQPGLSLKCSKKLVRSASVYIQGLFSTSYSFKNVLSFKTNLYK